MRGCATNSSLTRTRSGNGSAIFQRRYALELADRVSTGLRRHLGCLESVFELRQDPQLLVRKPGQELLHPRLEVLQLVGSEDLFELPIRIIGEFLSLDWILQGLDDDCERFCGLALIGAVSHVPSSRRERSYVLPFARVVKREHGVQ